MAGLRAAKGKRDAILLKQEGKADAVDAIHHLKDSIDMQLQSVADDVVTVRRLVVKLERTSAKQDWGSSFRLAAAIHTIASSMARKIEVCAAQADAVNKLAAAMKKSGLLVLLILLGCGSADDDHEQPKAVASVILVAPPAPAPLAVVSKPAPVRYWKDTNKQEKDD